MTLTLLVWRGSLCFPFIASDEKWQSSTACLLRNQNLQRESGTTVNKKICFNSIFFEKVFKIIYCCTAQRPALLRPFDWFSGSSCSRSWMWPLMEWNCEAGIESLQPNENTHTVLHYNVSHRSSNWEAFTTGRVIPDILVFNGAFSLEIFL